MGVIAQELEKVLPDMIGTKLVKLRKDDKSNTAIKTLDPTNFTYVLIKAVQEQQRIIERDQARITALEQNSAITSSVIPFGGPILPITLALAPFGVFVGVRRYRRRLND